MDWGGQLLLLAVFFLSVSRNCEGYEPHHDHHSDHNRHHKCVHSELVEPEIRSFMDKVMDIPVETHRSANARLGEDSLSRKLLSYHDEPAPFRVKVDYQIDGLDKEKAKFLKEQLIPATVGVLRRSLNIRKPVRGPLRLPYLCTSTYTYYPNFCLAVADTCGAAKHNPELMADSRTCTAPYESQCTVRQGGPGAADADFVLYVTSVMKSSCSPPHNAIASGGFCLFDIDNSYGLPNRPLAGVANFCPNRISTAPEDFGYMLDTAVHEVLHAILMSGPLMEKFIDENGQERKNTISVIDGKAKIVTPSVQKHVRDMFECDELEGAHLEDEGGSGTVGSHWESRMFLGEIMIGKTQASTRNILSNVTLALAEDSGWYTPNYETSGILTSGFKKGCEYVKGDCTSNTPALQDTFCWDKRPPDEQPNVCTPDHMAVGFCRTGLQLTDGCSVVSAYSNTVCTNTDHDVSRNRAFSVGRRHQPGARCFPIASKKLKRYNGNYYTYIEDSAACFATTCKNGQVHLQIPTVQGDGDHDVACPEGETVDLSLEGIGFSEGLIGPCPSAKVICSSLGCKGDCNGHGQCLDGKCICHVGYVGDDCKHIACSEGSCPGGMKCNLLLARCESNDIPSVDSFEGRPVRPNQPPATPDVPAVIEPTGSNAPQDGEETNTTEPQGFPEKPKETLPQDPAEQEEPLVPDTPKEDGVVRMSGVAVWNGYLAGCAVFADNDGDLKWDQGEPGVLTSPWGEWSFEAPPGIEIVLDPSSRSSCRDIFTGMRPRSLIRAPWGSSYLSPLSTLVSLNRRLAAVSQILLSSVDDPDEGTSFAGDGVVSSAPLLSSRGRGGDDASRVVVNSLLLSTLNLEEKQVVIEDVVRRVAEGEQGRSERAVVLSAVLANTITQISAYISGNSVEFEESASTDVLVLIGDMLTQDAFTMEQLANLRGALEIVQGIQENVGDVSQDAQTALAGAIAVANKEAFEAAKSLNGLDLLEHLAMLAQVAQGNFTLWASQLGDEKISVTDFSQLTSPSALDRQMQDMVPVGIGEIIGVEEAPKSEKKVYRWLDFEHSGLSIFIAVTVALALLLVICSTCCGKRGDAAANRTGSGDNSAVVVNPMLRGHGIRA